MAAESVDEAAAAPIGDLSEADTGDLPARRSDLIEDQNARRSAIITGLAGSPPVGRAQIGALVIGVLATDAVAIGALAVGRLAVGRLTIRDARVGRLEIDELVVPRATGSEVDRAG